MLSLLPVLHYLETGKTKFCRSVMFRLPVKLIGTEKQRTCASLKPDIEVDFFPIFEPFSVKCYEPDECKQYIYSVSMNDSNVLSSTILQTVTSLPNHCVCFKLGF